MIEQDDMKEALVCCSVRCEESGNPPLFFKGDEAANGLKETCHFFGCVER